MSIFAISKKAVYHICRYVALLFVGGTNNLVPDVQFYFLVFDKRNYNSIIYHVINHRVNLTSKDKLLTQKMMLILYL